MKGKRALLGRTADVVLILTCLLTTATALKLSFSKLYSDRALRQYVHGTYSPGDLLPAGLIDYRATPQTLLMFVSSRCRYCAESTGFYERLLASKSRCRVIAIGQEPVSKLQSYLRERSVEVDKVLSVGPDVFRVPTTPTLVLANDAGRVIRAWRGLLNSNQESEVISLLSRSE